MARSGTTVHQVAGRAGVSIATVSRVARGVDRVAPETRRRVLSAIEELGYRPSHLGRALVARRHAALGIVFPGLSGPYYSEVIHGFEGEAVAARQSVLILLTHQLEGADEQVLELASRVDGLAVFGGTAGDATLRALAADGLPAVLLAGRPREGLPAVRVDNAGATLALTLHLLQHHRYRRLAFVGNPHGSPDVGERWEGFVEAHRRAGLPPPASPVGTGHRQADGLVAADWLLSAPEPPRALVCANDETALGALGAAAARGVAVPTGLAITGWDDIPMAALVSPALSTVRQPMRELGARTARLLLGRLAGGAPEEEDVVLPTPLAIRASCGCPPGPPADPPLP